MLLSGIHVFITAGFPLKACGNDIIYKRLNVQLVFAKSLTCPLPISQTMKEEKKWINYMILIKYVRLGVRLSYLDGLYS